MTIDADTIISDADLDEFLGGQLLGDRTIRPVSWDDGKPARQWAVDEAVELLSRARPPVAEADITDTSVLLRAVRFGAAARLYQLASTSRADAALFYSLEKDYRKRFEDEVRRVHTELLDGRTDTRGRGRRTVALHRR